MANYKVTTYPQGCFSWADANVSNPSASADFYKQVLGWQTEARPITDEMNYYMFKVDGETVAGMGQALGDMPSHWMCYVNVHDVDAIAQQASKLGGKLIVPPMDVMEEGRMALIEDPSGAILGFWQPKNHIGATLVNTYGAMAWNELMTPDVEAVKTYYGALLGWTFEENDDSGYVVARNNGRMNGGIFAMSAEQATMQPNWTPYFTVTSLAETIAHAEKAGGTIHMPPTPGGGGQFAIIGDPCGAVFCAFEGGTIDEWEE